MSLIQSSKTGLTLMVVTGQHPRETVGGAELQAYWIAQGIHRLGVHALFCTWHSDKPSKQIEADGLIHLAINKRKGLIKRIWDFGRFIKIYRPEVVYVRCFYAIWWIKLLSLFYRYRVVYHTSSITQCVFLLPQEWKRGIRSVLEHSIHDLRVYLSGFADEIICQTNEQAQLIRKHLKRNAHIVYNGHPLPDNIPDKNNLPWKAIWIGKHWKNPGMFVELAEALVDVADLEFYMIGVFPKDTEKPYREATRRLPNFHFLGNMGHDEVTQQLESSHLLVNTSDYEGFSNTFIEAWLYGLPVVSLKVNPDGLLARQEIGLVSGGLKQMAADVRALLANGGERIKSYSRNAVVYARTHHDISQTSLEVLRICLKATEQSSNSHKSQ